MFLCGGLTMEGRANLSWCLFLRRLENLWSAGPQICPKTFWPNSLLGTSSMQLNQVQSTDTWSDPYTFKLTWERRCFQLEELGHSQCLRSTLDTSHKLGSQCTMYIVIHTCMREEKDKQFYYLWVTHKFKVSYNYVDNFILSTMYNVSHKRNV